MLVVPPGLRFLTPKSYHIRAQEVADLCLDHIRKLAHKCNGSTSIIFSHLLFRLLSPTPFHPNAGGGGPVPGPHPQAGGQLHRAAGLPGLQRRRWRHRLWPRLAAAGAPVRRLRQEVQARLHRLPLPPGACHHQLHTSRCSPKSSPKLARNPCPSTTASCPSSASSSTPPFRFAACSYAFQRTAPFLKIPCRRLCAGVIHAAHARAAGAHGSSIPHLIT